MFNRQILRLVRSNSTWRSSGFSYSLGAKRSATYKALGVFATASIAAVTFTGTFGKPVQLDSSYAAIEENVSVDNSINPFPTTIQSTRDSHLNFSLIGYGVRKVTFIKFKVYGLGIYIANQDIGKLLEVLNSEFLSKAFIDKIDPSKTHKENLLAALKDPKVSEILVNSLLDADVRFMVRIVPLRDTDFNHLRDGFIKSCVRNKFIKDRFPDKLTDGVDEIREVFKKYRAKCPKNHVLLVETDSEGKTSFVYENYGKTPENGAVKEVVDLGTVQENLVSKAILLNYFTGSNPIDETTRQTCIEEIANLS